MKMRSIQIKGMLLLLLTQSVAAFAETEKAEREDKSPLGCRNVGYQYTLKTLDIFPTQAGERQSLYFVYNELTKPIHLYQMRGKDDADAMSINHVIPPQRWAVLSIDATHVKYACTVDDAKTTYGQIVDCEAGLKVCQFVRVKYGMNNRGNFWMVDGNTKNGALHEVNNYGVIAR